MTDNAQLDMSGYFVVPPGRLTTAVTWLGMSAPPSGPAPEGGPALKRIESPDLAWYRALYRRIGEDWLWTSRLVLDDRALAELIGSPDNEVYVAERDGAEVGLVELDVSQPGAVEIVYFGLVPQAVGKGLGRALMAAALARAWRPGTTRVWLHTCTHDHPGALRFYQACGFVPYAAGIEIFDDPRLSGLLPRSAAPHVPLIEPPRTAPASR